VHELSLTQRIVEIVSDRAMGAKVLEVTLEIGQFAAVVPEALRFCFDVVARGTVAEGARLEIIEIPGRGRCNDCGREVAWLDFVARCPCGSSDLVRTAGDELNVKQMVTA
jgi:hydrogenase nickel incorporation protein HypA/HybF